MDQLLETLREALTAAKALDDIEAALAEFSRGVGYHHHQLAWWQQPPWAPDIPERPRMIGNIAAEWVERYWKRRYFEDDCIARTCLQSVLPVTWATSDTRSLTDRQRRIAREAARFGLAHGAAIAVRAPNTWLSVLTVARFRTAPVANIDAMLDVFTLGAVALTGALLDRIGGERFLTPAPKLKAAECQCMLWAARGKSTAQIAEVIGLSERTVYFHIGSAMEKLGVSSRVQAVAEAIKHGLIAP